MRTPRPLLWLMLCNACPAAEPGGGPGESGSSGSGSAEGESGTPASSSGTVTSTSTSTTSSSTGGASDTTDDPPDSSSESDSDDDTTGARPLPQGWCAAGDTDLSRAVLELEAGSAGEMPMHESFFSLPIEYALFFWSDSGGFDPVRGELRWVGGPGTCCSEEARFQMLRYSIVDDVWSMEETPYAGSGHSFDGNAIDPATGDHYFSMFDDPEIKRWDGTGWSDLPALPFDPAVATAMTWFPELDGGSLVYVDGYGRSASFDGESWTELPTGNDGTWGGYSTFGEYHPGLQAVLLGGGTDDDATGVFSEVIYRLDADGSATRLADAPVGLGAGPSLVSADPGSSEFVVYSGSWRRYDLENDTWTGVDGGTPALGDQGSFHVPLVDCAATFWFTYGDPARAFVYRLP